MLNILSHSHKHVYTHTHARARAFWCESTRTNDTNRYSGHCIQAVISARVQSVTETAKQRHIVQVNAKVLSGPLENPENLIVPSLEARVHAQMPAEHV
jgi:hypothetical protein